MFSPTAIPICTLILGLVHLQLFQSRVSDSPQLRQCRSSHNTNLCDLNICPPQIQNPSSIKTHKKESHGTKPCPRQERKGLAVQAAVSWEYWVGDSMG